METMIDPGAKLGDLVTSHPDLSRILDRWGLDYCCGGQQRLDEACRQRDIDVDDVVNELRASAAESPPPSYPDLDAAALVNHIVETHHHPLRREMPGLLRLADKVVAVHAERHPELLDVAASLQALWADLEHHLDREERNVFPSLASGRGSASSIEDLVDEHTSTGNLLQSIRRASGAFRPPADACASYRSLYRGLADLDADIRLHIHKENNVLFARVARDVPPGSHVRGSDRAVEGEADV